MVDVAPKEIVLLTQRKVGRLRQLQLRGRPRGPGAGNASSAGKHGRPDGGGASDPPLALYVAGITAGFVIVVVRSGGGGSGGGGSGGGAPLSLLGAAAPLNRRRLATPAGLHQEDLGLTEKRGGLRRRQATEEGAQGGVLAVLALERALPAVGKQCDHR